ncbi:MAG TPA: acyloxyacyl hydrolase [Granulicella sp.]|nr:acyloxyacyl hydrolase [Granulicella sp.]
MVVSGTLQAQIEIPGSRNTFGVVAEYSNDSSHIILGDAVNVKLGAIGLQYQRRLIANRHLVWSYGMEFRPVIIESNPTASYTTVYASSASPPYSTPPEVTGKCVPSSESFTVTNGSPGSFTAYTVITTCSREITYAQGFSPFGMKLNLRSRSRLQPTFSSYEGYIFSTRPVPTANAGSFNFDFEIGAGLEYYLSRHNSVRIEYQVQHFSNKNTAAANPGVDNGLIKLTYSFGR